MGQQHRRNVGIVLQQVALGDADRRPEYLVEIGKTDLAFADSELGVGPLARNLHTSRCFRPSATMPCQGGRRVLWARGTGRSPVHAVFERSNRWLYGKDSVVTATVQHSSRSAALAQ